MAVTPGRLQGVAADQVPAPELEALPGVADVWPNDVAHHIRLPAAGCAGAGGAEEANRQKGFAPIVPLDGQLAPDLLDVFRLEAHERSVTAVGCAVQMLTGAWGCNYSTS